MRGGPIRKVPVRAAWSSAVFYWVFAAIFGFLAIAGSILILVAFSDETASQRPSLRAAIAAPMLAVIGPAILVYGLARLLQATNLLGQVVARRFDDGSWLVGTRRQVRRGSALVAEPGDAVVVSSRPAPDHQPVLGRPILHRWTVTVNHRRVTRYSPLVVAGGRQRFSVTADGIEPEGDRR